ASLTQSRRAIVRLSLLFMNPLGLKRVAESRQLLKEGVRDGAIEPDWHIPGDGAPGVANLARVGDRLIARKSRLSASPRLSQVAEHLDASAVHFPVLVPSNRYQFRLVDLTRGKVFQRRDREDAVYDAGIKSNRRLWVARASGSRKACEIRSGG